MAVLVLISNGSGRKSGKARNVWKVRDYSRTKNSIAPLVPHALTVNA